MDKFINYIMAIMLLCGCACSKNGKDKPDDPVTPPVESKDVYQYTTTADRLKLFDETAYSFAKPGTATQYVVKITGDTYQTIDGFGAALTVSSCYNILKMPAKERMEFLKRMFDPSEGIGSSLVRIAIGGCDFSWDYGESGLSEDGRYTWCDQEGIDNFAPHPMDLKYVVPVLKEIYSINPDVRIIGSPWTAPRWMKTDAVLSGAAHYSWTGGRLDPKHYTDYASYLVKWIRYMQEQGFRIEAITPQNEPLNAGNSMSMLMYWSDCRDFIKVLGPAMKAAGLRTKILIFDHNYNYDNKADQTQYPLRVYQDAEASSYIAGSAWHNYGGSVSELDRIVREAPDKEIYFTEASIGTWNYSFAGCLIQDFKDIFMGTLSRNGRGVTLWNLMLDDKNGPYTKANGSCTTCWGAVTVASSNHTRIEPYTHYYNIAHCSKVIRPGAVRVGTSGYTVPGLQYQVFKNTDGTYGAVILNETESGQQLVFSAGSHSVACGVPAKGIVSLHWKD